MKMQKGQTLVIVFFLMILALSIGVIISQRFISNFRMDIRTDDYGKATSVADALLERLLSAPYTQLADYIQNSNCGTNCTLQIPYTGGLAANASAVLSYSSASSGVYSMNLGVDDTSEINLTSYAGGNLDICWNGAASLYAAYVYTQSSVVKILPYAYNATGSLRDNFFSTATALNGYNSCFTVTTANTPNALRLKAYYEDTTVSVSPQSGVTLPSQGITINVTGTYMEAVKNSIVVKTSPSVPTIFDNAITQTSDDEPLSNKLN